MANIDIIFVSRIRCCLFFMDCILQSLISYYGQTGLPILARRWLDSYCACQTPEETLTHFAAVFKEDPSLFGIDALNLKDVQHDLLARYYHNEAYVKSVFIRKMLCSRNNVVGYEYPIGRNRLDLWEISQKASVAYEIKTAYDTLGRLKAQVNNYLRLFENVYVICDLTKVASVMDIVPPEVGIYCYDDARKMVKFSLIRPALMSKKISPLMQRDLFPSRLSACSEADVNEQFKTLLSTDYFKHWDFLKKHMADLPLMDFQVSYRTCRLR